MLSNNFIIQIHLMHLQASFEVIAVQLKGKKMPEIDHFKRFKKRKNLWPIINQHLSE